MQDLRPLVLSVLSALDAVKRGSAGRSLMDDEQPRGKVSADTTILTFWYILIYCMVCSALYEGGRLLMNGRFAPGLSFGFAVSGEC
jgi:hypothetical protein